MVNALIGKKLGMSQLFSPDGEVTPVTVIQAGPCTVTQIKSVDSDGYNAVQLGFGERKPERTQKPLLGHFKKSGKGPFAVVREVKVDDVGEFELGQEVNADIFQVGELVQVVGRSKGKGFAGTIKRWNFKGQDATHGNSLSHRVPGSIGQNQTPGRVFKGKKMAGHMGNRKTTVQSLEVVRVDAERNLLLVKGAVPGAAGNDVIVKPAVKG
jgi:large subunit ribosomal protein L3